MKSRHEGLTIIELLVTIAIIGITFLALAMSQITGFRVTRDSAEAAIAKDAATEQMETIRAWGYEQYKGCPAIEPTASDAPKCEGTATLSNNTNLTLQWRVDNRPPEIKPLDPPPLVSVIVTVTNNNGGTDYELYTYLSCADADFLSATQIQCPVTSIVD